MTESILKNTAFAKASDSLGHNLRPTLWVGSSLGLAFFTLRGLTVWTKLPQGLVSRASGETGKTGLPPVIPASTSPSLSRPRCCVNASLLHNYPEFLRAGLIDNIC